MAYNPKKKVKKLLRIAKKALKVPKTPLQKKNYIEKQAKKMDKKPTKPERLCIKLLKELKIKYETQKIVGGKIFDLYLPEQNLLIEVDGGYWHAENVDYLDMNDMQKRSHKNDSTKNVIAVGYGYKILRITENRLLNEYKQLKEEIRNHFL